MNRSCWRPYQFLGMLYDEALEWAVLCDGGQIGKAHWRIACFLHVWQLGKTCLRGKSPLSAEDVCCFLGKENVRHNVSWFQKIRSLLLDRQWWPFQNPAFEIYFPASSNASRLSVMRGWFWLERSWWCCSATVLWFFSWDRINLSVMCVLF